MLSASKDWEFFYLFSDVLINSHLILSADGTMPLRVWSGPTTNSTLLLKTGQTITNGLPHTFATHGQTTEVWVEFLGAGAGVVPSSGRCFHDNVVHLFMAAANGFKGTFKWVYGTHVFTGGAIVAVTPDFLNQPQSITVTFTPDGGGPPSSATVALSYCAFAGNGTGGGLGAAEYGSDGVRAGICAYAYTCIPHWCHACGNLWSCGRHHFDSLWQGTCPVCNLKQYDSSDACYDHYPCPVMHELSGFGFPPDDATLDAKTRYHRGYPGDDAVIYPVPADGPGCCPCAAHANGRITEGRTASTHGVDIWLMTGEGPYFPPGPNASAIPGWPVYVRGMERSVVPWDRWALFTWKEYGKDRALTNNVTVFSCRVLPNQGTVEGSVAERVAFPPAGWDIQAAPGALRPLYLLNDSLLQGHYILSLSGAPGVAKIWAANSTNGTPLLVIGQAITNGLPHTFAVPGDVTEVWLEAVSNGTATVTFSFEGSGLAQDFNFTDTLNVTAYEITPSGQVAFTNAPSNVQYKLSPAPSNGTNVLWTISGGAARFADDETGAGSSSTASGASVWVNPGHTGGVYTITCNIAGSPSLELTAGLVVSREISWSPSGDKIYVWHPINDFHFSDAFVDYMTANYQGWETGANNPLTVFHDPSPDDDDFGTCTLENFKAMANGGLLFVQSHGQIGQMDVVWCKTEAAANAWKGDEPDMYVFYDNQNNRWKVIATSQWFLNNWKPFLDQRRALVFLKICCGADGFGAYGYMSVASCVGGQTVFAVHGEQVFAAADTFFQAVVEMMNGTSSHFKDDRSALSAFLTVKGKMNATPLDMVGDGRTTLCPAPQQVFPTSVGGAKAKWGCILFDTYMDNSISAGTAVVPVTGTINSRQWGQDAFYIDFTHNGQSGKAKAVNENCRSLGQPSKRMDGDGKAPLIVDDDKEWEW